MLFYFGISCVVLAIYYLANYFIDRWIPTNGPKRKRVLITGCDSGFGLTTALHLSESNCEVFAGCLTQGGVDRLTNDKLFRGMAFIMDITKSEDIEKARKLVEENGGIDGIVNNAGICLLGLFEWNDVEKSRKVFEVNYWGPVRLVKALLPLLKKSRGRIINVSSISGRVCMPYVQAYSSSKHALEAFSDTLRLELQPWGVSVHVVQPSYYSTEITKPEKIIEHLYKSWEAQPQYIKDEIPKEMIDKNNAEMEKSKFKASSNLREVSGKIKHALLSPFPRRRYPVGPGCNLFMFLAHLPSVVTDHLFWFFWATYRPVHSPHHSQN